MADPEVAPTEQGGGSGGIDIDAYLEGILGAAGIAAEGQLGAAKIGSEAALAQQAMQQQFLKEGAAEAAGLYAPFIQAGNYWGGRAKTMIDQGAPKYSWDKEFSYDPWKWDKEFSYDTWDQYSKEQAYP